MRLQPRSVGIALAILVCVSLSLMATHFGFRPSLLMSSALPFISSGPRTHEVAMTRAGFSPKKLTIVKGDTVRFLNQDSVPLWPASDPHPTHEYLSGFDPRHALEPGASWSFTFNTTGDWRFHDHLYVTSAGEIHVLGPRERGTITNTCDGKCFDELIRSTVASKGIDAAYRLFQDTYEKGALPRSCHWTAHQIGEAAYELYAQGKDFSVSHATSYCGYGFYHGFLEHLLRVDPDPKVALKFCDVVKEKLGQMGLWNCYHGIGHGYTEDPPPPDTYGDFDAMIKPGIRMCEYLFGEDFRNLNLCLTGVYTVPTGFASDGVYGLKMNPDDFFNYCRNQPYRYKKACYGEFSAKLEQIPGWKLDRLPAIVESLNDEKLERLVVWTVPSVMMAQDILKPDHSSYISECRKNFSGRLREICWGGSMLGFFHHGEPEKQYEPLMSFCNSSAWSDDSERRFCWGEAFRQMRQNYTPKMITSLCPLAPEAFRPLCFDEKKEHVSPYDDPSFE